MNIKYISIFILCIAIVLLFSYLGTVHKQTKEGLTGQEDDTSTMFEKSGSGSAPNEKPATTDDISASVNALIRAIIAKVAANSGTETNLTYPVSVSSTVKDFYGNMLCEAVGANGELDNFWATQNGTISKRNPGLTKNNASYEKKGSNSGGTNHKYQALYGYSFDVTFDPTDKSAVCKVTAPDGSKSIVSIDADGKTTVTATSASGVCDETDYQCLYGKTNMWPSSSGKIDFSDSNSAWAKIRDEELWGDDELWGGTSSKSTSSTSTSKYSASNLTLPITNKCIIQDYKGNAICDATGSNGVTKQTKLNINMPGYNLTGFNYNCTLNALPSSSYCKVTAPNGVTGTVTYNANGTITNTMPLPKTNSYCGSKDLSCLYSTPHSTLGTSDPKTSNVYYVIAPPQYYGNNAYRGANTMYQGSNKVNGYDNYNHYTGKAIPTLYNGPNGSTAKFVEINGNYYIILTRPNGNSVYSASQSGTMADGSSFTNTEGHQAQLINTDRGKAIVFTDARGKKITYYVDSDQTYNPNRVNQTGYESRHSTKINQSSSASCASSTTDNTNQTGIPADKANLYMLKSAMVPPSCPVCGNQGPSTSTSGSGSSNITSTSGDNLSNYSPHGSYEKYNRNGYQTSQKGKHKYPPCPACERCPEPDFTCRKVPNYNHIDRSKLPKPILNDFTTFGM